MRMVILAGLIALGGCASVGAAPLQAGPEAVFAAIAGKEALRVRVLSGGCTKKADFEIVRTDEQVLLRRVTRDPCQSFVMGSVWLDFTYAELGVEGAHDFTLANPLRRWTGPGE